MNKRGRVRVYWRDKEHGHWTYEDFTDFGKANEFQTAKEDEGQKDVYAVVLFNRYVRRDA